MTDAYRSSKVRPLTTGDLARVVAIDANIVGRRRPVFFEKRVEAALTEPGYFIYIGYEEDGNLVGFQQARLLEGEYGATEPVAVLDNIGVDPAFRGRGIASAMMQEFAQILKHKKIHEIQTQTDWRNLRLLRFLDTHGFLLAPRQILEREVGYVDTNQAPETARPSANEMREKDYSDPSGDQTGALARDIVPCRSLEAHDLPAVLRIDRKITGHAHTAFYERKVKQALHESGIRVSLVAEFDGQIVGFVMARVDFGEFDRTEPTSVMDSIGVDPGFRHRSIGSALLSQLLGNLASLRIETIRTEIDADHFDVLRFLTRNGFRPSQELAFSRRLT